MTIVLTIIIVILTITVIVGIMAIRNLLHQNDALVETIQIYSNKIDSVEVETIKYYKYFLELFTQAYQELQRIDKRGSFSSDDEVGFTFKVLFAAIENVKEKLRLVEIEEEENSEKR